MTTLAETRAWIELMRRTDSDAGSGYELRGEPALLRTDLGAPTMNAGYWRGLDPSSPDALRRATAALFGLVANQVEAGPSDAHILDAGCGAGTFAALLLEQYGVRRVTGLDVARRPLAQARALLAERGLADSAALIQGSATQLPFEDASFSAVVSVESAFHFNSRADFFREAFRVLKPGGRLGLADYVATPPTGPLRASQLAILRRALQIPAANVQSMGGYLDQLEQAGFEVRVMDSIVQDVLPPYFRNLARQPLRSLVDLNPVFITGTATFFLYPWDYVVVSARKPL
jgi:ubiquinone/menaquinone biosynthesis C-methylase UbiE